MIRVKAGSWISFINLVIELRDTKATIYVNELIPAFN